MREVLSSTDNQHLKTGQEREHSEGEKRNRGLNLEGKSGDKVSKKTRKKHFESGKHMVHLFKDSVHTIFHFDFMVEAIAYYFSRN